MQRLFPRRVRVLSRHWLLSLGASALLFSSADASAPPPRTQAERILQELPADDGAPASPRSKAAQALQAAVQQRELGQVQKAEALEAQALEWAEVAAHVRRALQLEEQAADVERELATADANLQRMKVLLEETASRKHRAQAQLDKLQSSAEAAQ